MSTQPTNHEIADVLERIANLLENRDGNPFRVRAYRAGAQTLREHEQPVADFIDHNAFGKLTSLPNIGEGIASVIGEFVSSGQSALLQQLEAEGSPIDSFTRVPGIGKELAGHIINQLDIETLPELEEAAHDGRLATVDGFGERRVEAVRAALGSILSQSTRRRQQDRIQQSNNPDNDQENRPPVELLLQIDEQYRHRAETGKLRKIAPRRFNPDGETWLPIWNTERDGWAFTALYSNTAQAHKLDKTRDWVVIYYERNGKEGQNTVVTETQGLLKGERVVRGRGAENRQYYAAHVTPRSVSA